MGMYYEEWREEEERRRAGLGPYTSPRDMVFWMAGFVVVVAGLFAFVWFVVF